MPTRSLVLCSLVWLFPISIFGAACEPLTLLGGSEPGEVSHLPGRERERIEGLADVEAFLDGKADASSFKGATSFSSRPLDQALDVAEQAMVVMERNKLPAELEKRIVRDYLAVASRHLQQIIEKGNRLAAKPNLTPSEKTSLDGILRYLDPLVYHTGRVETDRLQSALDLAEAHYPDLSPAAGKTREEVSGAYFLMLERQAPPSHLTPERRAALRNLPRDPAASDYDSRVEAVRAAISTGDEAFASRLYLEMVSPLQRTQEMNDLFATSGLFDSGSPDSDPFRHGKLSGSEVSSVLARFDEAHPKAAQEALEKKIQELQQAPASAERSTARVATALLKKRATIASADQLERLRAIAGKSP